MRYCKISKEMSSLYFGLVVFCQFESVPKFDTQPPPPPVQCTLYSEHWSNSGTLVSNWQNTSNPKYNNDISLLISQYLISGHERRNGQRHGKGQLNRILYKNLKALKTLRYENQKKHLSVELTPEN
jgi:hypothetical protein